MKQVKKLFRPKSIAFLAVAMIFAMSGLLAGFVAPISTAIQALTTGQRNLVVANYNIYNLPRAQVLLGSTVTSVGTPSMSDTRSGGTFTGTLGTHMRLFRVQYPDVVEITNPASASFDFLGTYEWRFFTNAEATATPFNPDRSIHRHAILVYQDNFAFGVPTSSTHAFDVIDVDGTDRQSVSWIPNVSIPERSIQLPLPNQFIDSTGNDLFEVTQPGTPRHREIQRLRRSVLSGWGLGASNPNIQNPISSLTGFPVVIEYGASNNLAVFAPYITDENFKHLIWANTRLRFFGPNFNHADLNAAGTDRLPATSGQQNWQNNFIFTGTSSAQNANDRAARTFTPMMVNPNFFAQYEFVHNRIGVRYSTNMISIEAVDTNDVEGHIVFRMPADFDRIPSGMRYGQDFVLPTPTINIAAAGEIDANFTPVQFSPGNVTNYTFIRVLHLHHETGLPTDYYDDVRIGSHNNFTFRPLHAGRFSFRYYTRTFFGTGNIDAMNYGGRPENRPQLYTDVNDTIANSGRNATGMTFIRHYPHGFMDIVDNQTPPELRWSVPFAYVVAPGTTPDAHENDANGANPINFVEYGTGYAATNNAQIGDVVAVVSNPTLGIIAGDILNRIENPDFFNNAPDLIRFMPSIGHTPSTQISDNQPFVIPALLGMNHLGNELHALNGRDLRFQITITRRDGITDPSITFDNFVGSSRGGTNVDATATHIWFDHTRPLEIPFHHSRHPIPASPTQTINVNGENVLHAYREGGILQGFTRNAAGTEVLNPHVTYQIIVNVTDQPQEIFSIQHPRPGAPQTFSFNLVRDQRGQSGAYQNDFEMHLETNRPTFNGTLHMNQTAFYQGDTISFREMSVTDRFTPDVQIQYYIIWGQNNDQRIRLDERFIRNGMVSFELNPAINPEAQALIATLSATGQQSFSIVAVAKNFYALTNSVQNDFTVDPDFNGVARIITNHTTNPPTVDETAAGLRNIGQFVQNPRNYQLLPGIAVQSFQVTLFDLTFGAQATLGMLEVATSNNPTTNQQTVFNGIYTGHTTTTGTPPNEVTTRTRVNPLVNSTPIAPATTRDDMNTIWQNMFSRTYNSQFVSNVYQNRGVRALPVFTVQYAPGSNRTLTTTVEFSMLAPVTSTTSGLIGQTIHRTPVTEGAARPSVLGPSNIGNFNQLMRFDPLETGDHTFIATVVNSGGFVTIFTANIVVLGVPTVVPEIVGGVTSLRVGQSGSLPSVRLHINGQPFITDIQDRIIADVANWTITQPQVNIGTAGAPNYVDWDSTLVTDTWLTNNGVPTGFPAGFSTNNRRNWLLIVGYYAVTGWSANQSPMPVQMGNNFVPMYRDTYNFDFDLRLNSGYLNRFHGFAVAHDISRQVRHSISVTEMNEGDFEIGFGEEVYNRLTDTGFTFTLPRMDNNSLEANYNVITQHNVIPQMVATNVRDISISNDQFSRGMMRTGGGRAIADASAPGGYRWDNDTFEFGRIFLPTMQAIAGNPDSALLANHINSNLANHTQVTVAHNRDPENFILDSSRGINEERIARVYDGGTFFGSFFWFQPQGTRSVPKPDNTATQAQLTGAGHSVPASTTDVERAMTHEFVIDGTTYTFFFNPYLNGGQWVGFDYTCENYLRDRPNAGTPGNQAITPDGTYTVRFTISFGEEERIVEFMIRVGDTATPTITFKEGMEDRLFGDSRALNSWFEFNTRDYISIIANGGQRTAQVGDRFEEWWVARNLTITVMRPGGVAPIDMATQDRRHHVNYITATPQSVDGTGNNGIRNYRRATGGERFDRFGFAVVQDPVAPETTATATPAVDTNGVPGFRVNIGGNLDSRAFRFNLSESGTYTITFQIVSASGVENTLVMHIIVDPAPERRTISPQTIWGTILIVISSGLLLGVVVYFVQTGRKTKFVGSASKAAGESTKKSSGLGAKLKEKLAKDKKDKEVKVIDNPVKE